MVASLVKMCQEAAMKNVADIRDVGEIRYEVVKPILKKIVTPAQLVSIPKLRKWYLSYACILTLC